MYIQTELELSLVLSTEKFNRLMEMAADTTEQIGGNKHIDQSLIPKGIVVTYHNKQYKKKVQLKVEPHIALDDEKPEPERLVRKLEKRVYDYFGSRYGLNDFILSGVALTADINVGSHHKVAAYLKVLQRVGKVKGYSPPNGNSLINDLGFCLIGNSNGVEFWLYDLEGVLREQLSNTENGRKELKAAIDRASGMLRAEVRMTKPKAVRACTEEKNASGQIADLTGRAEEVFLDAFRHIIPPGDYYKKGETVKLIQEKIPKNRERKKMLRLLELIPKKKSLWLAMKAMNDRNIDEVIEKFAELDVSPVTISKRHDVKHLKSLHSYLED